MGFGDRLFGGSASVTGLPGSVCGDDLGEAGAETLDVARSARRPVSGPRPLAPTAVFCEGFPCRFAVPAASLRPST